MGAGVASMPASARWAGVIGVGAPVRGSIVRRIAVDRGQRERGGAAEDETAVAGVDLALDPGDGLGLGAAPGGRRGPAGNRPWVVRSSAIRCIWVARARRNPGPPKAGAGGIEKDVEPVARNRQGRLAEAGLAVPVADPDGQPAGEHGMVLQLLDQPLEVADQPGVKDDRDRRSSRQSSPRATAPCARGGRGGSAGRGRH